MTPNFLILLITVLCIGIFFVLFDLAPTASAAFLICGVIGAIIIFLGEKS